jgi:hypothetical protein
MLQQWPGEALLSVVEPIYLSCAELGDDNTKVCSLMPLLGTNVAVVFEGAS